MSLAGQLRSSRQLKLPVMQWLVALFGEFHSFPRPKLSLAAQFLFQSIIPSLAYIK